MQRGRFAVIGAKRMHAQALENGEVGGVLGMHQGDVLVVWLKTPQPVGHACKWLEELLVHVEAETLGVSELGHDGRGRYRGLLVILT